MYIQFAAISPAWSTRRAASSADRCSGVISGVVETEGASESVDLVYASLARVRWVDKCDELAVGVECNDLEALLRRLADERRRRELLLVACAYMAPRTVWGEGEW